MTFLNLPALSCYTCTNVDQTQCLNGKNLPLEVIMKIFFIIFKNKSLISLFQNCTSQSYEKLVHIKPVCIKIMKISE